MISIITSTKDITLDQANQKLKFFTALSESGIAFEWVVQDCNADHSVLEVLQAYDFVSLKSEADTGIYSAWNKALDRVKGENICFLGLDDFPLIDWLIFASKASLTGNQAVSCDVQLTHQSVELGVFKNLIAGTFNIGKISFAPPGLVFSKDIFIGKRFLEKYSVISDGLFYSSLKELIIVAHFGGVGVKMEVGGVSNSPTGARKRLYEFMAAIFNREIGATWSNIRRLILANLPSYCLSFFPKIYVYAQRFKWRYL